MKKYLLFLLNFTIVSVIFYLFKEPLFFAYQSFLILVMSLFSGEILSYYYDSSFRLLLLASLLLATPGIAIKRRLLFTLYGLCSLWCIDLISFFIWTTPPPLTPGIPVSKIHIIYSLIWRTIGHWVLPFVLWVLMTRHNLLARFDFLGTSKNIQSTN